MNNTAEVLKFIDKHGLACDAFDFDTLKIQFLTEMENGLESKSSLDMLPSYLQLCGEIKNGNAIAIDAGGSFLRVMAVNFDMNGKAEISYFKKSQLPGFREKINSDEFFLRIAEELVPVINKSDRIGFTFSFATKIDKNLDAMVLSMSKEINVAGLVGKNIGEGLNQAIEKLGYSRKKIVLLNDTTAALLGARSIVADECAGGFIGFILGTGANACYFEDCSKIKKDLEIKQHSGKMIINIESGGFDKAHRGTFDLQLDEASSNKGEHLLEKMLSGAYLGDLACLAIKQAMTEGLIAAAIFSKFSTVEVNEFIDNASSGVICDLFASQQDRNAALLISQAIFHRAAKLCSITLAAILEKTGDGMDELRPVMVSLDGSVVRKSKFFRTKFDGFMETFIKHGMKRHYCFVESDELTAFGTAIASYQKKTSLLL